MGKNKKTILLGGVLVFVVVSTFLLGKMGSDDKEDTDNNAIIKGENSDVVTNNNSNTVYEEEVIEEREGIEIYTEEELKASKDIAVEFSNSIFNVDSNKPLIYPTEAIAYTIQPLTERILDIANNEKSDVYKRIVTELDVVGNLVNKDTKEIIWKIVLKANVFNEEEIQVGTERGNIDVLIVKTESGFKVGEYSIERTINNF